MIHNWGNYFDIGSEYWKKVERIYEENESFPKKVVKDRNLHHKFPRSFSKKDGAEIDNDDDNLVSISLADHFRVHYYLWKCAKKGYRGMMAKAFVFMRKKAVAYATDETIEQLAKDYEEAMKEASEQHSKTMKGRRHSEEHKKKISEAEKGRRHSEDTKKKISEARKGKPKSEETKKKMSAAKKGKTSPNKGKHPSEEARKKMSEAHKGKTSPNKGKHFSEEHKKKISEAKKGKHPSEEARKKMSEANKGNKNVRGKHWYNNGKINVMTKECPEGFVPGIIK